MDKADYERLFVGESRRHLDAAYMLLQHRPSEAATRKTEPLGDALLRHVHTIKGMAAALQLEQIVRLAHTLEDRVVAVCQDVDNATAALLGSVNDGLDALAARVEARATTTPSAPRLKRGSTQSNRVALLELTSKYTPLVHAWGASLHKDVRLVLSGQHIAVPPDVLSGLHAPLVHLLRNAVDHGIEPAAIRAARGKPSRGRVLLRAFVAEAGVRIVVSDDGGGLDAHIIAQRAVQQGLVYASHVATLNAAGIFALLMRPGFSLAPAVTTFSGRGTGLDSVRADLRRLGATLEMSSTLGRGSQFCCCLPQEGRDVQPASSGAVHRTKRGMGRY